MIIIEDKIKKARKEHKCELCGEVIQKGEKYNCLTCVDDGIITHKTHLDCLKYRNTLDDEADDGFIPEYSFLETVQEEKKVFQIEDDSLRSSFKKILVAKENKKIEYIKENGFEDKWKEFRAKGYNLQVSELLSMPPQYEGSVTDDTGHVLFVIQDSQLDRFKSKMNRACNKVLYR